MKPVLFCGTDRRDVLLSGPWKLQLVARQLWSPLTDSGNYRVALNAKGEPGWDVVRRFVVTPTARTPRLLVGIAEPGAMARALNSYGGLRTSRQRFGRLTTAAAVRVGLASRGDILTLERRVGSPPMIEPLAHLEHELKAPLNAIVGVRTGANSKATLQLFSRAGEPFGYAKVAWNETTQGYVRRESEVLLELGGRAGPLRVPLVLTSGSMNGSSYLVTRPLPPDVTTLPSDRDLSVSEFTGVAPFLRFGRLESSGHFLALLHRIDGSQRRDSGNDIAAQLRHLATVLRTSELRLPIATRWHGDLVPWNTAEGSDGTVWIWDWEMCEEDAAVGLDVLHWSVNRQPHRTPVSTPAALVDATRSAAPVLRALGLGHRQQRALSALYALVLAERSVKLADEHGGWQYNRLQPTVVTHLLRVGRTLAEEAGL